MPSHEELRSIAVAFSLALATSLEQERSHEDKPDFLMGFGLFPCGGCAISSRWLKNLLQDYDIDGIIVCKQVAPISIYVGNALDVPEHTWLEVSQESGQSTTTIIDLTCCQFGHLPCPFVSSDRTWHDIHWTHPAGATTDTTIRKDEAAIFAAVLDLTHRSLHDHPFTAPGVTDD